MATSTDRRITRWVELTANIATVVMCVLLVAWWLRGNSATRPAAAEPAPVVGQQLSMTSIGEIQETSLLLFLRTDCRFCTASADFYKRLNAIDKRVPVIAIFGEAEDQARQYLDSLGVPIADLRHAQHRTMAVGATPVALLVDRAGVVKGRWIGQLSPDGEADMVRMATAQN